jgi:peroxiredoxin
MLKPGQPVPALEADLVGGGRFVLAGEKPERFTLLLFYRGLHCQRCKGYLGEIDRMLPDFSARGVGVAAISCDSRERAEQSKRDWKIESLRLGYGLAIEVARRWGLYISRAIRDDETPIFAEPGTFLVEPDGRLHLAVINSITRMRPYPQDILDTIDRLIETGAEPRGEA